MTHKNANFTNGKYEIPLREEITIMFPTGQWIF